MNIITNTILTKEEIVWLSVYVAEQQSGAIPSNCNYAANLALGHFNSAFPKEK